ncbi:MAG: methyltransferase domain-containing protein [Anaerolineales bacterium]|nr:methyltransferase domain-containing protein [Anaerolineales bacterium]
MSEKRYETLFDAFYQNEWKHDSGLSASDLLLAGYPFTVDIRLAPGERWLELGVGSGRVVDFHQEKLRHSSCIGVDRSFAAIQRLKATLPVEIDALVADIRHLPFKKGVFDLITLFGTVQAYPKAEWLNGIDRLMPWLTAQGVLGFSVHPVSGLELIRGLKNPSDYKELATQRFLRKQLLARGYAGRFSIDRHSVYVLLQKITTLAKVKLENWYGFTEYRDTPHNRRLTQLFDKLFATLSFGHFWVWISASKEEK